MIDAAAGGGQRRTLSAKVLAVDANLLLGMDARRFLCAMQELTGGALLATHQVMAEAWDKCTETSAKAAEHFVRHHFFEGKLDAAAMQAEIDRQAMRNTLGWRRWAQGEKARNDAAWQQAQRPDDALVLQTQLLTSSGAFTLKRNRAQDALVVAEAILAGVDAIASHNLNTILHEVLNEWLADQKDKGHPLLQNDQAPFILKPDAAMQRRRLETGAGDLGWAACRWAAGACLPKDPSDERRFDFILRRFLEHIGDGGLPVAAASGLEWLSALQQAKPQGWTDDLAAQRAHRTQRAEDRRLAVVKSMDGS